MATPLDIGALEHFEGLFPFLLIFTLIYAFLARTDWFKDKQGMAALIAVVIAFMTLLSDIAIKTVNMMAPWFVLLVIFITLFILAFMVFGFQSSDVTKFVSSGKFSVGNWVMAIMLIIGLGSLSVVVNEEVGFGDLQAGEEGAVKQVGDTEDVGFWQTLFHPKILGLVLLLLLSFFTIKYMASRE